jgi:hypothetical protein
LTVGKLFDNHSSTLDSVNLPVWLYDDLFHLKYRGDVFNMELLNCWEITKCQRQRGGKKVLELGECIASKEEMGHSCWAVAGTLCGGKTQGTTAQKIQFCTSCEVYEIYNRSRGELGKKVKTAYPKEDSKYYDIMMKLHDAKTLAGSV